MTNTEKEATVKLGGMQAHTRDLFNKGIGSEGTCSTAGDTAAKVVTLGTTFELVSKATILVKFTNAISVANATLAVTHTDLSGTTTTEAAKPIYYRGAALAAGLVKAGDSLILRYDGTSWNILGVLDQDMTDTYPDLTAGNIIGEFSDTGAEFAYRPTAGAVDIESGQADFGGHLETIKGNTIAWNQLVQNGNFSNGTQGWSFDNNPTVSVANNELTIVYNGSSFQRAKHSVTIIAGHKYIVFCSINAPASLLQYAFFLLGNNVTEDIKDTYAGNYHRYSKIFTATKSLSDALMVADHQQKPNTGEAKVRDCMCFDLTLIYGEGNEPTTPEAFEADYQKWFGKPLTYEEYDEGSLRNVKMTGIKTVGFNLYDGNPIKVLGSIEYQITGTYTSLSLDGTTITPDAEGKFTPDTSGTLTVTGGNATTCVHFVHSGARDDEFEPYWESTLNVPITTLKGKLNGQGSSVVVFPDGMKKAGSVYDEIVRRGDKTYAIKRVGSVDLGSLEWVKGDYLYTYAYMYMKDDQVPLLNKYMGVNFGYFLNLTDKVCSISSNRVRLKDLSITATTSADIAAALSGVILNYELATPEEYLLDDFELPQNYDVDDYGTEEILLGTDGVAPILDLKYGINAGDTIKNLPHSYVSAVGEQNFTEAQKERARKNIGAAEQAQIDLFTSDMAYLGSGLGTCATAATTVAKEATLANYLMLKNIPVSIFFEKGVNVADATLNINSQGAKPIFIGGSALQPGVIRPRTTVTFVYDGTNYNIISIGGLEQSGSDSDLWVDMGLPSGTLWAKANIDVTTPSGFAEVDGKPSPFKYESSFFSWGNTDGHNPISNNAFDYDFGTSNSGTYASTPGASLSGNVSVGFDAARANLGAPWREPTGNDFTELFNSNYTKFIDENGNDIDSSISNKLITMNEVVGIRLKSKINGNILFFAGSGTGGRGTAWTYGSGGTYWSSKLSLTTHGSALVFTNSVVFPTLNTERYIGCSIRPVQ